MSFNLISLLRPITLVLALSLVACASGSISGGGALVEGTPVASRLARSDLPDADSAVKAALNAPGSTAAPWRGRSGNSGTVTPGDVLIAGLSDGGEMYPAPPGLFVNAPVETALGDFRVARSANFRLGPNTSYRRLGTLGAGTTVRALGRDNSSDWYLIANSGRIMGYIYGPLMEKVSSGELMLAGGPTVTPDYCRAFTHEVRLRDGETDVWRGTACRGKAGYWSLARSAIAGM